MTTVPQLTQTLQTLFTTTAEALARRTGFVQRQSKMGGARFAQALMFGWLANPQASLENLAQAAAAVGVAISAQGLDQRCGEAAAAFLEALLGAAVQAVVAADAVAIPLLQRFSAVVLLDCSTIVLPAALGPWWPGCGGSTPEYTQAALKIGVRYDLCRGQLLGPLLFDGRTHESTTPIQHAPLPKGALRLADLGFFDLEVFAQRSAPDGYWLTRLHRTTAVYDAAGQRRDVLALLATQGTTEVDLPITLGVQHHLPARLLAVRVPQEVADQRRRRLRAAARDRGRSPSAASLAWCDWTIFVTNVPPMMLSLREALVLARARWQVELLFKLWKSHGQIDASRSRKPWRVLTEVYAKLLAMVVQHWLVLTGCWGYPDRSLVKAAQTVRQHALHLASALACPPLLEQAIGVIHRCLAAGCRLNRRKTKPNTYQLLLDPALQGLG
jgi:Transposase DDE domain